jgi:phosphate-selective porin OprO/OprP
MQQQIYRQYENNLNFNGFYIYASWFLTGESRNYDSTEAIFGHTKPKHNLHQGGIGAWEIGIRYSYLDLTDDTIFGGTEDNITLGLNWHPNNNMIFKANVIMANTDNNAVEPNDDPLIFLFRFQFEF